MIGGLAHWISIPSPPPAPGSLIARAASPLRWCAVRDVLVEPGISFARGRRRWFEWCLNALLAAVLLVPLIVLLYGLLD